jgi:hypothetical protein
MNHNKKVIVEDYTDPVTGIRCIQDDRGDYHFFVNSSSGGGNSTTGEIHLHVPEIIIPPAEIKVEITPPVDDPEKQRLIRVMEKLRSENNWLWGVLWTAVIDRKKKGAPTAMDELERKIKEKQS